MIRKEHILIPILIVFLSAVAFLLIHSYLVDQTAFFHSDEFTKNYKISMLSPFGEPPQGLQHLIELSDDISLNKLEKKEIKVAVSMHDKNNHWSLSVLEGINRTLQFYNIEVIAVTNGEFKPEKQIIDIKNLIKLDPDYIISLPLNSKTMVDVYNLAKDRGIKLIFLDSIPDTFLPKKDYLGLIIGDSFRLGVLSAKSLIEHIEGSGKVATLNWANSMFTVDQRTKGAREVLNSVKEIEVVDEIYFKEFYEIPSLINDLLIKHPDLDGLWTVWDTPALEAISSIKNNNLDIAVTTVDLNNSVAKSILSNNSLKSTAVDHPFFAGIAAGLLVVLDSENIKHPSYIVTHAEIVNKSNIKRVWKELYREPYIDE